MIELSDKLSYLLIPSAEIIRHRISLPVTSNPEWALGFIFVLCCKLLCAYKFLEP